MDGLQTDEKILNILFLEKCKTKSAHMGENVLYQKLRKIYVSKDMKGREFY